MSNRLLSRLAYGMILRLHPAGFHRRFGGEMLEIFDLASGRGHTAYLFCDGVRSLLVQHARPEQQEQSAAVFGLEIRTSSLTVARVGQAMLLGATGLLAMASLIGKEMPPASHQDDQASICQKSNQPQPPVTLEIKP